MKNRFNPDCKKCSRLVTFLDDVRKEYPEYHSRPVAPFGVENPGLLIVGLAPGKHGANATGRPFTGDYAGVLLYKALYLKGFSNQAIAVTINDGLELNNCRITNAVKCLPPDNKPTGEEIKVCNQFLANEIRDLSVGSVILALGGIAHNAVLRATGKKLSQFKFGHANEHDLGDYRLIDSYHCSRYNTQTKRLTEEMFLAVFDRINDLMMNHDGI